MDLLWGGCAMTTIDATDTGPWWPGSAHAAALSLIGAAEERDRRIARRLRQMQIAAITVLLLNVLDVMLTQYILRTHPGAHEGNMLLAGIVMTGWIWLPKLGLPLVVGAAAFHRPVATRAQEFGIYAVWGVYWAIVIWNIRNLLG
jgi:hypothetical protein